MNYCYWYHTSSSPLQRCGWASYSWDHVDRTIPHLTVNRCNRNDASWVCADDTFGPSVDDPDGFRRTWLLRSKLRQFSIQQSNCIEIQCTMIFTVVFTNEWGYCTFSHTKDRIGIFWTKSCQRTLSFSFIGLPAEMVRYCKKHPSFMHAWSISLDYMFYTWVIFLLCLKMLDRLNISIYFLIF